MKLFKLFLSIVLSFGLFTNSSRALTSGSSHCLLNLCNCSISCPTGSATCTSGLFSCCCSCTSCSTIARPSPSGQQTTDAGSFYTWLGNYGTSEMTDFATKEATVISSLSVDDATYTAAEIDFSNAWAALTSTERSDIITWRSANGYCW
jgi:hypothetical protein